MKKIIRMFCLVGALCIATTSANAQSMQEVVCLKNGSMIRGTIIEQVPGVSLRIQTRDGNVFVYKMEEVEKITKEVSNRRINGNGYFSEGSGLGTRYRGFFDFGYTVALGDLNEGGKLELSTSHGVQISPYFFMGAGVGISYFHESDVFGLPIFAHLRSDVLNNKVTPFIDIKVGYSVAGDANGLYLSPSFGARIAMGEHSAFNVSIGYTLQRVDYYYHYSYYGYGGYYSSSGTEKVSCKGLTFKIGLDF